MSFPRYPAYKDSGVEWLGEVPDHWEAWKLAHAFGSIGSGTTPPSNEEQWYDNVGIPWVTTGELRENIIMETKKSVTNAALDKFSALRVHPAGSLVVAMYGATIGRLGILGIDAVTNQACCVLSTPRHLDIAFTYYWLQGFKQIIIDLFSTGGGQPNINQDVVASLRIPAPGLAEQAAIANFLDHETAKIDALVAEQERLIELLKEKRQAVISQAVTKGLDPSVPMKDSGVEWLGEVPAHWEVRSISSVSTKITNGYVGPTRDILVDDGVRYLQSLHIKGNRIRFDQPYYVREEWSLVHSKSILESGDVLIVQTGDIGQVAVVPPEFAGCNCHALIIVSPIRDVLSGEWLSAVLNSDYGFHSLLSIQTGALHPHLNCGNVKFLVVPVPPRHEQDAIQNYIAERVDEFDDLIHEAVAAIDLLRERRTALISAAVTGQIDVRSLASSEAAA